MVAAQLVATQLVAAQLVAAQLVAAQLVATQLVAAKLKVVTCRQPHAVSNMYMWYGLHVQSPCLVTALLFYNMPNLYMIESI